MAFVPSFEYDIFISYAHVDNLTDTPEAAGWVEKFHECLRVRLAQRFGRDGLIKIWRDENLTGDQLFDQVIQNRINKSAVFLALNSHGYQKSDYCGQEIKWFHHKAQQEKYGLRIGERMRFFHILLYDISHTEWPEEFGRTSGFPFFDKKSGEPLEPDDKEYKNQIRELGNAIYDHLTSFRKLAEPTAETEVPPPENTCDVFLAEVADSLRTTRKRVISDLEQKGFKVHPKIPPPYEAQTHEQAVKAAINQTALSVHLLDGWGGAEIQGDESTTYLRKQVELGTEQAKSQLIWIPKSLNLDTIADEEQKNLLLRLQNQPRETAGNFLRGLPTEITDAIIEKLEEIQTAAAPTSKSPTEVPPAVLLDIHVKDQYLIVELCTFLLKKNILPYINPQEDDPRRNIEILKDRLKRVSAMIVFFGQVGEEWVRARLVEAMKISIEESYPVNTYAVYLAPPRDSHTSLQFGPALPLDNRGGFDPKSLEPLLRNLGMGGEG